MSIRIITGSTGTNHVTSQDDGSLNQVILGSKSVVLDIGEKMAATVVDNNTVRISDGDILLQGRHARIDAGTVEDMTIGTGTIEMNRNDLIVARYTLDTGTGFENIELVVLEGTETSGSASDPAYNTGNIRTGSSIVDFPLYRVRIEGINIVGLVRLFEISGGVSSSLIADAYLSTKSYGLGEYCIDNGVMWKSRTNNNIGNTPAEGTYWTRISIANEVSTLNQNLTAQDGEPFRYAKQDGKRGIIVNEEGADTFIPFSSLKEVEELYRAIFDSNKGTTYTFTEDYPLVVIHGTGTSNSGAYVTLTTNVADKTISSDTYYNTSGLITHLKYGVLKDVKKGDTVTFAQSNKGEFVVLGFK